MHDMGTTCHFFEKTTHIFNSVVLWFRFVASNPPSLSLSAYPTNLHIIYICICSHKCRHTHMDMYIYIYVRRSLYVIHIHLRSDFRHAGGWMQQTRSMQTYREGKCIGSMWKILSSLGIWIACWVLRMRRWVRFDVGKNQTSFSDFWSCFFLHVYCPVSDGHKMGYPCTVR